MTAATKVSSCVDCATPIIGDRLRCPACHDRHAGEDDVTVPRPRSSDDDGGGNDGMPNLLTRWVVAAELFVIVVLVLIVGARGCLS